MSDLHDEREKRFPEELCGDDIASAKTIPLPSHQEAEEMMAQIRAVSVSDLLDLTGRMYARLLRDNPEDIVHAAGYAYMEARCVALADLFRDPADISRCVLDGKASGVDLLRGLRVLAARHKVKEGREIYASMGNACCAILSERVGGVGVDVEPALNTPDGSRATLTIWYQQVALSSRAAVQIQQSRGRIETPAGIVMVGKAGEVRARLIAEFRNQGFGELGLLLDVLGLDPGDPTP